MRWLDGIPDSWTWIWVNSRSWWWTGRPGVLWFMGLQRVGHEWATDLIWSNRICWWIECIAYGRKWGAGLNARFLVKSWVCSGEENTWSLQSTGRFLFKKANAILIINSKFCRICKALWKIWSAEVNDQREGASFNKSWRKTSQEGKDMKDEKELVIWS